MDSLRGHLLVAGPGLIDPNFRRTVVLVGEHGAEGAMGVVLNRPSGIEVEEAVPPLVDLEGVDDVVFVGGPVQPQAIVVLGDFADPERAGAIVFGSIGFLPSEVEPTEVGELSRARVFAGYAGWGAGSVCPLAQILSAAKNDWVPSTAVNCDFSAPAFRPGRINDACDVNHFWSLHAGGANFAFADGSVRFLRYSSSEVMPALATRAGGEVISTAQ